jgi:membrane-bound ClpP family serine protease
MAKMTIDKRRKIRQMEAKRDRLIELNAKSRADLVKIRAELKHARKVAQ